MDLAAVLNRFSVMFNFNSSAISCANAKIAQVSKALAARRERVEQAIQQKDEIDAAANPKLRELGENL